jgi:hypothetical protein
MERAGFVIHWLDLASSEAEKMNFLLNFLATVAQK